MLLVSNRNVFLTSLSCIQNKLAVLITLDWLKTAFFEVPYTYACI